MIPLVGYPNRWSVAPKEKIEFKVSSQFQQEYSARLVRITCADPNPDGCGILEHDLSDVFVGKFPSRLQKVQLGSYAVVDVSRKLPALKRYSCVVRIWPTLLSAGKQTIISFADQTGVCTFEFAINSSNQLAVLIADSIYKCEYRLDYSLRERAWYEVAIKFDADSQKITMLLSPLDPELDEEDLIQSVHCDQIPQLQNVDQIFFACAGGGSLSNFYNGKLEFPKIVTEKTLVEPPNIVAGWDFSRCISSPFIEDLGDLELNGEVKNCPARAMKGSTWSGKEMCWRHAPDEYAAIHFHEDDIYDCNWETDFEFTVPPDFRSGMYSMRIECEDSYEDIPFYVRTQTGQPQSRICVVVPTFTYTVYSNQARMIPPDDYQEMVASTGTRKWNPDAVSSFGLSTYNEHTDGSGICYSSLLRPSLTMRPNYITICRPFAGSGMRHLPADTHLFAWLEHMGHQFDVVTDDDVHEHGYELLRPYQVVINPSHPEYHTANTLDAIYHYSRGGGRLMYLGGNGFYWKVALNEHYPGMVEIRRAEGGIRAWASEPGEYYNSFDGEYGGLWLRNGRPPQKLCGVGFSGQGDFQGTYYRRRRDIDAKFSWVFEGIEDETLGDFGLSGGGAAGFELDRADVSLGTPRNAVILANSETYPDHFVLVPEEMFSHLRTRSGLPESELIRAEIVIFETPRKGCVFSVGSISYCGSLPWNNFDNNISKLTDNVLRRFLREAI